MTYIDTNIIVYSYINISDPKQVISSELIERLIAANDLLLSPLVIQELIFVLNKLKVNKNEISRIVKTFSKYCPYDISVELIEEAYDMCFQTDRLKSINDAIHLKFAEKYGSRLITFDNDFAPFKPFTGIEVEILNT
jgi:predicted nucleic acid-binding protein